MNVTVLGQGYEAISELSVGKQLIKLFADKHFHSFTGISAFASRSGIYGLEKHIAKARENLKSISIIVGVNERGTSKEALEAILNLKINSFIFYFPQSNKSSPIFHPKVYLFEGENKSELIIGSANLTSRGLFSNVEASLLISTDNSIEADRKIVEQIKEYFKGVFDFNDPNLVKITKEVISDLVTANVVPTEAERKEKDSKIEKEESDLNNKILSRIFPPRAFAKIPNDFRRSAIADKKKTKNKNVPEDNTLKGKLVWTRKKLPSSSVQGGRLGTNPTGGLRLVQDDFMVSGHKIDQTSYFRHVLFDKFEWHKIRKSPFVEATKVLFDVSILNEYKGTFELEIRHKPSGESGQGNYTTSVSWGELGETIGEANLTGYRLDLYSPKRKNKPFQLVIS